MAKMLSQASGMRLWLEEHQALGTQYMYLHQKGQQEKPDGLDSAQAGSLPRFVWVFYGHHRITAVLLLLLLKKSRKKGLKCHW